MERAKRSLEAVESVLFLGASIGAATILLNAITSFWLNAVNAAVPEPYMDEIFHVPQAQAYCRGDFRHWDPNITTPPGLYLVSWLAHKLGWPCDAAALRRQNALFLHSFSFILLFVIKTPSLDRGVPRLAESARLRSILRDVHTAFNACLFPVLFFFSALYYTDVVSTFFVLLTLGDVLTHRGDLGKGGRGPVVFATGVCALLCRQTNVFWVAVFPAGLIAVDVLKGRQSDRPVNWRGKSRGSSSPGLWQVAAGSWRNGSVYDIPIQEASFYDYIKTAVSLGIAVTARPVSVVAATFPQLLLLASFGAFVVWNGSVVLGDKSHHVATIHTPQLLYIWPFITLFSFPIVYPHVLAAVLPSSLQPPSLKKYSSSSSSSLPSRVFTCLLFLGTALASIHFNTIVHPFLLADNRHYTFYVFRYLNLHPAIKYLAAPVYLLCGRAVLQALSLPPQSASTPASAPPKGAATTPAPASAAVPTDSDSKGASASSTTSFALVWLGTTALCTVGAPLVEPRYFILPWLAWRLRVPSPRAEQAASAAPAASAGPAGAPAASPGPAAASAAPARSVASALAHLARLLDHGEHRLWLETAWLLALDAALGYVFFNWGFAWASQPGKVQRFLF